MSARVNVCVSVVVAVPRATLAWPPLELLLELLLELEELLLVNDAAVELLLLDELELLDD